jgi:predicted HD phosphohydrolase
VLPHEIGQAIEHDIERRHARAEQGAQHCRLLEQAVHIEPEHVSCVVLPRQCVRHHRAAGRHCGVLRRAAVVDFVAGNRHA